MQKPWRNPKTPKPHGCDVIIILSGCKANNLYIIKKVNQTNYQKKERVMAALWNENKTSSALEKERAA